MRAKFKVDSITQQGPTTVVQLVLAYRKNVDPVYTYDMLGGQIQPEPEAAYKPKDGEPFDVLRDGARGGSATVVCYTPESAAVFAKGKAFWLVSDDNVETPE